MVFLDLLGLLGFLGLFGFLGGSVVGIFFGNIFGLVGFLSFAVKASIHKKAIITPITYKAQNSPYFSEGGISFVVRNFLMGYELGTISS